MPEDYKAVPKTYDLIMRLLPQIIKIPRSHRFVLGEKIETTVLHILELLIEATYEKEKIAILKRANIQLEKLRYFIRICKDMKFISIKQYEYVSKEIDEVGRLIGGWIKQQMKG